MTGSIGSTSAGILIAAFIAMLVSSAPAQAIETSSTGAQQADSLSAQTDAEQFCRNITDAATDARYAWQAQNLERLEKDVQESIARLETKRAEYEEWLRKREQFLQRIEDVVVEIYSRMEPDAAAAQLASMAEDMAAAMLVKLNPRRSSAILNEMEPARAAKLADILTGVRKSLPDQRKPR